MSCNIAHAFTCSNHSPVWHHIPSHDGSLYKFCKRKIDTRLQKIVDVKVKKALAKEDMKRARAGAESGKGGEFPTIKRQPTLPVLDTNLDDKLPEMPMLSRQGTQTTLPEYTEGNDPPPFDLEKQPTLPRVFSRPIPSRSATQSSQASYASNAPLISSAAPIEYGPMGRSYSPVPYSPLEYGAQSSNHRPVIGRSMTGNSQSSQWSHNSGSRPDLPEHGRMPHRPTRQNTAASTFSSSNGYSRPLPPSRQDTATSYSSTSRFTPSPFPRQNIGASGGLVRQYTGRSDFNDTGRNSPSFLNQRLHFAAQTTPIDDFKPYMSTSPGGYKAVEEYELQSRTPHNQPRHPEGSGHFVAYNPSTNTPNSQNFSAPTTTSNRNFTTPNHQPQSDYFSRPLPPQRSGTAPIPTNTTYDDSIYDSYSASDDIEPSRPSVPVRAATAGPRDGRWN